MAQTYTALIQQRKEWWIGWIEEIPGVNCQERTREELLDALRVTLVEALEFSGATRHCIPEVPCPGIRRLTISLPIKSVRIWESQMFYECMPIQQVSYPPDGCRPPKLYKYPAVKPPVKLLFLGWNPPKPYGGFWSDDEDNLRSELRAILKDLGQINASSPDQSFLDEFLGKGFYLIHTVKCWTDAKFPGFGRGATTREGRDKKEKVGIPLINSCVRTHLEEELNTLAPQKVCALGEVPFLGLCELFRELNQPDATPTQGRDFQREQYGIPWPLLYTCFPQGQPMQVRGTKCRKPARDLVRDHLQDFLQSP